MMKRGVMMILSAAVVGSCFAVEKPAPQEVKAIAKKVAGWQMEHFRDDYQRKHEHNNLFTAWTYGACYVGLDKWAAMGGDETTYEFLKSVADQLDWKLGKRKYHADDHLIGRLYMQLAEHYNDPGMYADIKARLDSILEKPSRKPLTIKRGQERWTWCDALFMAPPVWAQMARITDDGKYLDFMMEEYKATYDHLYDPGEHLFFRDANYFKKRDEGRKVFWSRGNGWVFGGLALIIDELPEGKEKEWFVALYKEMAPAIAKLQTPEGFWAMSLLCADKYPTPETSGTSFFTFGLAWGINNGLLDRATFEPVVLKAWNALASCVNDEGMLGWVQPVGAAPGESYPDKTEVYGIGAFLAAGSEVYKLVGGTPGVAEGSANHSCQTFMPDAGWCWYEDPRAIIHDGKLIIGGVSGTSGDVRVGVYDLKADRPLGVAVLHEKFQPDDHDSPAFHVRSDGSLLAVYARHNNNPYHCSRISEPGNPLLWGKEMKHVRASKNPKDKVTYMNLYTLKDQGLLCNFYRGLEFNPTLVTSTDEGLTWSDPIHFITHDIGSRQRPYARYAQIDENTVGISFTDAHPRQYGNSLYYAEFRDGTFYNVDGTEISKLAGGPLHTGAAEKIYKGSEINEWKGHTHSVTNSAWTCTIAPDAAGNPHIGYTVYHTHQNHHYRIASWDGKRWHDRQIAFGGSCLYDNESSYTGLFAIDPEDPSNVYISTDVDPTTGKSFGGVHEIYSAKIGLEDDVSTIQWKQLTFNSEYKNIRPILVAGEGYKVLLWLGGHPWHHYQSYETDAQGLILQRP